MIRLTIEIEEKRAEGVLRLFANVRQEGVGSVTQLELEHSTNLAAALVRIHRDAAVESGADYFERVNIAPGR